jgi:hypothetical protein
LAKRQVFVGTNLTLKSDMGGPGVTHEREKWEEPDVPLMGGIMGILERLARSRIGTMIICFRDQRPKGDFGLQQVEDSTRLSNATTMAQSVVSKAKIVARRQ